ncbi:methyltransferase domain protein, partial [Oesophagostomum dentatum]
MRDQLEKGGMTCLDVGCGKGIHYAIFAEKFPQSNFTGIDITPDAIRLAKQQKKENGEPFDNLEFIQMDGSKMDKEWSNKYDLVTIFNAAHDQMRPDLRFCNRPSRVLENLLANLNNLAVRVRLFQCLDSTFPFQCLKEIYRILKPGGIFAMCEVNGTSNIYKDKQEIGDDAASEYVISLFHCLPVGSNSKDALGLGAMWGKERAVKLIKEAGFKNVTVIPTPY